MYSLYVKLICKHISNIPKVIKFEDYHCFWSPSPSERHFAGVALLIKKSSFWQVNPFKWSPEHPCYPFYQDNRLLAVQLWFGRGGTSMLVYVAYGPSGSRSEPAKRLTSIACLQLFRKIALRKDRFQLFY